jgi:hypothetical protein
LPGATGLRGMVSEIKIVPSDKNELHIVFLFSPVFLAPVDYEDNQVLLDSQVKNDQFT